MINFFRKERTLSRLIAFGKQSLVKNAGYLMGIYVINACVGFLFWWLAAHLYRPEEVGITSAVISAAFLVCGLTDFGLSVGMIRFLPETQTPIKFLNTLFSFEILTSVLAGVAFLVGISIWTPSLIVLQKNWIFTVIFLIYITFYTLGSIVGRSFVARRKSLYYLLYSCIINGCRILLVVLFFNFGSAGLTASLSFSFLLAALISLFYFLPKIEPGYRFRPSLHWPVLAAILPYSLGNYVVGLLTLVSQRLLPLLIIEILGPASSGHFYIAWMISDFLNGPSSALSDATFAEGSNSPEKLDAHLRRSAALGLGITVPAAIIVCLGAPFILMLFGPSYAREASDLLRLLALAAPLGVIVGLYFTSLKVKKQINQLIAVSAILAGMTLGITYALLPRFGITAVGIGQLIGNSLMALVAVIALEWPKRIIAQILNSKSRKEINPL
jgi:O-antigen/teichoic acid export membrane protein